MANAKEIVRIAGGIFVTISGLMLLGLFGWEPPVAGAEARPFQIAMHDAGYFLPIITATFLLTGVCLILNLFGALASLALLPVSINIVLFHAFLEAGQLPLAIGFFAINCFMLWYYRSAYGPLLDAKLASSCRNQNFYYQVRIR